jgi:hypothetical protein
MHTVVDVRDFYLCISLGMDYVILVSESGKQ